jgi:hypothetical protein
MGLQAAARSLGENAIQVGGEVATKAAMAKLQKDFQHH